MNNGFIDTGMIQGISQSQVPALQKQYGKNIFSFADEHRFLHIMWGIVREPMFLMLATACSIYFILGEINEGVLMAVAIGIVVSISLYQEIKSSRALNALKQFTAPKVTVIRDGQTQEIDTGLLVPGDIILLEEGMKVPADAQVLQQNDLSVDESIISGESLPVDKNDSAEHNLLYQGTTINSGKCIARILAIGNNTALGKIGKSLTGYTENKTLLQAEVNKFVRRLAIFGLLAFLIIFLVNYLHYRQFTTSLLFALTLAMSAVPEEIPVAFSSFMALGAYKMSRFGIISRQPQVIENLGAVTVLCLDKTGTITENKMKVAAIYDYANDQLIELTNSTTLKNKNILLYGTLASELHPFDAMEKAIWEAYLSYANNNEYDHIKMIHEYPLEGKPPMMTHVYQQNEHAIAAAKGATERVLRVCNLNDEVKTRISDQARALALKGYRILGVASAVAPQSGMPARQDDFNWHFEGLLALYDPPKKNIADVLTRIQQARIEVKLITGDYPETTMTIANQAGLQHTSRYSTGEEVMSITEDALKAKVKSINIFARMFPEAKLKVINAIRANGDTVAMTGDGVNDGPALKAADIGIAMGKKGTETAKQASDLILTDDNLEKIVIAVQEGRKIYSNLVKAIRYIISIHIPIILTASLPVILSWKYPNIFTPIHVIFLELIMGPTCSIFFEREPVESSLLDAGPRDRTKGLFTREEFLISVVQGLMITAGVLLLYFIFMRNGRSIEATRTVVFTTIILGNIFLTFSSRSFTRTIYYTFRYKNPLAPVVFLFSATLLALLNFSPFVRQIFGVERLAFLEFGICVVVALISVLWFEVYKMDLRKLLPRFDRNHVRI